MLNVWDVMPALVREQTADLVEIFRVLGNGNRLHIMVACLDDPQCVGDIARRVGISPTLVSHHLRLLRAARCQKLDKQVFYAATDEHVPCIIRDMAPMPVSTVKFRRTVMTSLMRCNGQVAMMRDLLQRFSAAPFGIEGLL
ncbi:winged helix-turn-helix transcriptional regulator [Bosea sp. SSUT16]|uniref:Winged helix-turn-helix transcriptional regulator n=1 Tax=Bosea spartocytisi TaxID=2773451 RepID=A0A927EAG0_9HYPH|nr:metalloregulator ArsR/SmtB family transcription factor [Bosea spartocytisi]MBD3847313.1 winged helix-turn-helix transcriptional regulator [Bosea spartocytisi]MCT4475383.1 ArsR family transcriptional regulator [Bosea spartocytisi]